MALRDPHYSRIAGPARALGQCAIHHEPGVASGPVAIANIEHQSSAGSVQCLDGMHQVSYRVRCFLALQWYPMEVGERLAGGIERARPSQNDSPTVLQYGVKSTIAALPHRRRDFCHHDRRRASVGNDLGALDSVKKCDRLGRSLDRPDRNALQTDPLH